MPVPVFLSKEDVISLSSINSANKYMFKVAIETQQIGVQYVQTSH